MPKFARQPTPNSGSASNVTPPPIPASGFCSAFARFTRAFCSSIRRSSTFKSALSLIGLRHRGVERRQRRRFRRDRERQRRLRRLAQQHIQRRARRVDLTACGQELVLRAEKVHLCGHVITLRHVTGLKPRVCGVTRACEEPDQLLGDGDSSRRAAERDVRPADVVEHRRDDLFDLGVARRDRRFGGRRAGAALAAELEWKRDADGLLRRLAARLVRNVGVGPLARDVDAGQADRTAQLRRRDRLVARERDGHGVVELESRADRRLGLRRQRGAGG